VLENKGVSMRISPVIAKLTAWASLHCLTRYICLAFLLLAAVAYPNQTLAADASRTQSKQMGGNETITGAFGIKFGEDITPYIGRISQSFGIKLTEDDFIRYKILNPPVNMKEMFPDVSTQLLGISDDKDRVIMLRLSVRLEMNSCDTKTVVAITEFLRGKYKIRTPLKNYGTLFEEYGDGEGNTIQMSCNLAYGGSLDVTYRSHLMSDYIARLKAEKQKQKDEIMKSLRNGL
jgi:hypothetical protein